jgi:hypothetical protein
MFQLKRDQVEGYAHSQTHFSAEESSACRSCQVVQWNRMDIRGISIPHMKICRSSSKGKIVKEG